MGSIYPNVATVGSIRGQPNQVLKYHPSRNAQMGIDASWPRPKGSIGFTANVSTKPNQMKAENGFVHFAARQTMIEWTLTRRPTAEPPDGEVEKNRWK